MIKKTLPALMVITFIFSGEMTYPQSSSKEVVQKDATYIGVNGGDVLYANHEDFEKEILYFNEHFFNEKGTLLNTGGDGTPVIPMKDQHYERNFFGNVDLKPSTVASALPANHDKLFEVIDSNRDKPAVTYVLVDHGDENFLTLWHDKVGHKELSERLVDKRSPQQITRVINSYCDSGNALKTQTLAFVSAASYSGQALNFCGLSTSDLNQAAAGGIGNNEEVDADLESHLTPGKAPSLQDLQDSLNFKPTMSTAMLSSDFLIDEFLSKVCDSVVKAENRCPNCGNPFNGLRNITDSTKVFLLDTCGKRKDYLKELDRLKDVIGWGEEKLDKLTEIKYDSFYEYLKDFFPKVLKERIEINKLRDALASCKILNSNKDCQQIDSKALEARIKKSDLEFSRIYLKAMEGPRKSSDGFLLGGDDRFEYLLQDYYRKSEFYQHEKKENEKESKDKKYQSLMRKKIEDFRKIENYYGSDADYFQEQEKASFVKYQVAARSAAEIILRSVYGESVSPGIYSIYENMRRCETTPINKTY